MLEQSFNPCTQEEEARRSLHVGCQSHLHSELEKSQSCTTKTYSLKKTRRRTRRGREKEEQGVLTIFSRYLVIIVDFSVIAVVFLLCLTYNEILYE